MVKNFQLYILCFVVVSCSASGVVSSNSTTAHSSESSFDEKCLETSRPTLWMKTMDTSGSWISKGLTGQFLQTVLESLPEAKLSAICRRSMEDYVKGIKEWTPWAIYMADANAKFPSGILDGVLSEYGAFEQCLAVRAKDFQGQYCLLGHSTPLMSTTMRKAYEPYIQKYGQPPEWIQYYLSNLCSLIENGTFWLGACLPSTCSEEDIKNLHLPVASVYGLDVHLKDCQIDTPKKLSSQGVIALYGLLLVLSFSLFGTLWDVWISPVAQGNKTNENESVVSFALRAFSVPRRIQIFQKECQKKSSLDCFHGIRMLACFVVIGGHTYMYPDKWRPLRMSHMLRVDDLIIGPEKILFSNGVIVLANFFYTSGFLLSFSTWHKLQKGSGKISIVRFFLHRLMRILPSFLLLIALLYIMPVLSRAPLWNITWSHFTDNCDKSIWANLLFIHNYWAVDDQCFAHTWFLSALMQCQMIGLFVLIIAYRFPKFGIALGIGITVSSLMWMYNLSDHHNLMPMSIFLMNDIELTKFHSFILYIKSFTHIAIYLLGMISYFLIFKFLGTKLSIKQQILGWTVCIFCLLVSIVGIEVVGEYGFYVNMYNALHRFVFSIALMWIAFVCVTGNGGFINRLLSCRPVVFTSNISFMAYILHPLIYLYKVASVKEHYYFGHVEHQYDFAAIFFISFGVSFFAHILVEAPFNELEKALIGSEIVVSKQPPKPMDETSREVKSD